MRTAPSTRPSVGIHGKGRDRRCAKTAGRRSPMFASARDSPSIPWWRPDWKPGARIRFGCTLPPSANPLVGDRRYGAAGRVPFGIAPGGAALIREFPRQALHAHHLAFAHPKHGARMRLDSKLPEDMSALLATLREAMP